MAPIGNATANAQPPMAAETGNARGEQFGDREIAPGETRAKVAMGERGEVIEELPPQRRVELIDAAQRFERRRIQRPLEVEGPARRDSHQRKRQRQNEQQGRRGDGEPDKNQPGHNLLVRSVARESRRPPTA